MNATTETPKIYVACLAAYNSGILHGEWMDVPPNVEELEESIQEVLESSPVEDAEEWAFHDFEGFHGCKIEEYDDLEHVVQLAERIAIHGEAFALFADNHDLEFAVAYFEEAYCGEYDCEQDYAEELIADCYDMDAMLGNLACYFDYASYSRDLFIGDNFSINSKSGNVFVYRNM